MKTIKYFSSLLVLALALIAGWWLWNYYMQSTWTRDGKVRAEQVTVRPDVVGTIANLRLGGNEFVHRGVSLY